MCYEELQQYKVEMFSRFQFILNRLAKQQAEIEEIRERRYRRDN